MDDGCSPTVGILIFAGFVILDFVVFGFIAAMQNLNEAAIERLAGEEDRGARLLRRYTDKNERYTHVCELVVLIVHMLLGFLEVPLWRAYFLPEDVGSVMSVLVDVLIFVILILIVLVFGIYTPQKVASQKAGSLGTASGGTGTCGGASFLPDHIPDGRFSQPSGARVRR